MVPIVVSRPLTSLLAAREPFRSFPPALERQVIWERRPCSRLQRPPNPPMPRNRKCCSDGGGVALAGATGGGLIGSGCQRGGGAERVARSRGGAAAARAAWVGCGLIHSGAPHNPRLEPTALSRRFAEVVEPAAEVLSGGSSPGPRGGSAASR